MLAFDIGSNEGITIQELLNYGYKVVSFEPNPNLFSRLLKEFKGNPDVILENLALDNIDGNKIFNICSAPSLSTFSEKWMTNSRFSEEQYWDVKIPVNTISLDSAINKYGIPDYIKIDVEGYELEVLKGLSRLLDNTIICFEWVEEDVEQIDKCINHLKSLGYTAFSYALHDSIIKQEDIGWDKWENLKFYEDIDANRKEKWGMIYTKKRNTIYR